MPGIEDILESILAECTMCKKMFKDNVALIVGDSGQLTYDQVEFLIIYFNMEHRTH